MEKITYRNGDVIFSEGAVEDWMFDIRWGSVGIYSEYGTERQKQLAILNPNDFFGEMGMIEELPRSATAVALENTTVYKIRADEFAEYFADQPIKVMTILQYTCHRMRELSKEYLEACGALSEYMKADEAGEPKSEALKRKLRKYVSDSRKKKK